MAPSSSCSSVHSTNTYGIRIAVHSNAQPSHYLTRGVQGYLVCYQHGGVRGHYPHMHTVYYGRAALWIGYRYHRERRATQPQQARQQQQHND